MSTGCGSLGLSTRLFSLNQSIFRKFVLVTAIGTSLAQSSQPRSLFRRFQTQRPLCSRTPLGLGTSVMPGTRMVTIELSFEEFRGLQVGISTVWSFPGTMGSMTYLQPS